MRYNINSIYRGDLKHNYLRELDFYAYKGIGGWVIIKSRYHPLPYDILTLGELLDQFGSKYE